MSYLGNQPATGENNSFKLLDDITSYTLTFDGSSASVVSVSNDTITSNSHRFITAQRVTYTDGSGSAIGGLTDGSVYYIIKSDQNTFKLALTENDANNDVPVPITSLGTGTNHTINVAFDGVNTKFKATYDNGTKAQMSRAAQLQISINGVIQQPQDTATPANGFGIDADSVIVFSIAPSISDVFWGNLVANNFPTFDISDNTVDSFTGDNSTVTFTLSKPAVNNQNVLVTLDGVVQYPSDNYTERAYSVYDQDITFTSAPGTGVDIQVRHIGFAGATSSSVTGFYGRTGNAVLKTTDNILTGNIYSVGIATFGASNGIGTVIVGVGTTALLVQGNARITGILSIGQGTVTIDGDSNTITANTFVGDVIGTVNSTSGVTTVSQLNATDTITAVDANFSGNVSIAGTLSYEDVTNIDSIGIITARSDVLVGGNLDVTGISTLGNTVVGGATTELIVTGDARITGILTIGTSSVTLDGTNNQVNVGAGVTIHHTNGVQVGTNTLHSTGFTVNNINSHNINSTGIITASSFVGDGANLTGINGFASALASSGPLNNIFKTSKTLEVTAGVHTVNSDAASDNLAFMRESIIHVAAGATFHIGSGTTLRTNVLSLF